MRKLLAAAVAIVSMSIAAWYAFSPAHTTEQIETSLPEKTPATVSPVVAPAPSRPELPQPEEMAVSLPETSIEQSQPDEDDLPQANPEMAPGVPVPTIGNRNPYIEAAITPAEAREMREIRSLFKERERELQAKEQSGDITPEEFAAAREKLLDSMEERFLGLLGQERAEIFAEATAAWTQKMITAMQKDLRGEEPLPEELRPKGNPTEQP